VNTGCLKIPSREGWRTATAVAEHRGGFFVMNAYPEGFGSRPSPGRGSDTLGPWLKPSKERRFVALGKGDAAFFAAGGAENAETPCGPPS